MTPSSVFQFSDERPPVTEGTRIVRIPSKLNRKRRLLAEYARQLAFPSYFGWNWDALEECLNDCSWLAGVREVIVVHRDLPFANSPEQQAVYLSILQQRAANTGLPRVTSVFPPRFRGRILQAVKFE